MERRAMPVTVGRPSQDELAVVEAIVEGGLGGQIQGFQLFATDEGLVLRGRVRSYYSKQLAQHAIMETTTLPIAANEIEIVNTPR